MSIDKIMVGISAAAMIGVLCLVWSESSFAVSPEQDETVKTCTYVAGAAAAIQTDRIDSDYTLNQMLSHIKKIYKDDEGRDVLLAMAIKVYSAVGEDVPPSDVFDSLYVYCITNYNHAPESVQEYMM